MNVVTYSVYRQGQLMGFDLGLQAWQAGILGTVPLRQMVLERKKKNDVVESKFKDCLHREGEDESRAPCFDLGETRNVCNLSCNCM